MALHHITNYLYEPKYAPTVPLMLDQVIANVIVSNLSLPILTSCMVSSAFLAVIVAILVLDKCHRAGNQPSLLVHSRYSRGVVLVRGLVFRAIDLLNLFTC